MKKHMNIKRIYLFTILSLVITALFLYFFAEIAPEFYTGFDMHTSPNTLSKVVNFIFKFLLLVNCIGVILCIVYPIKMLFNTLDKL